MVAPNNYQISNYSALQREADGLTAELGSGANSGDVVSLVVNDVTTATVANSAVPVNPASPAVPASTVAAINTNPYAVNVSITGGTVTVISVNGKATGLTSGSFVVPPGGTIAITYSVAPTWVWTNAGGSLGFVEVLVNGTLVKVPYFGV